ncbi:MAG: hypothetical protein KAW56_12730 [Candidatus Marinimicrobia bacterium]|nr:hypothetical protein [Candidatus Neomarinimicrobiota bacterium]
MILLINIKVVNDKTLEGIWEIRDIRLMDNLNDVPKGFFRRNDCYEGKRSF